MMLFNAFGLLYAQYKGIMTKTNQLNWNDHCLNKRNGSGSLSFVLL